MYAHEGLASFYYSPTNVGWASLDDHTDYERKWSQAHCAYPSAQPMQRFWQEYDAAQSQSLWLGDYHTYHPESNQFSNAEHPPMAMPAAQTVPSSSEHAGARGYEYHSPSVGGMSASSYLSSCSEADSPGNLSYGTSQSSPTPSMPLYSPEMARGDVDHFSYAPCEAVPQMAACYGYGAATPCVSMPDVELYEPATIKVDTDAYEDDPAALYAPEAQHTYPMQTLQDEVAGVHQDMLTPSSSDAAADAEIDTLYTTSRLNEEAPNIRRRRQNVKNTKKLSTTSKKRQPPHRRATSSSSTKSNTITTASRKSASITTAKSRYLPCTLAIYGCPATFNSKNEWKRHINTQHMHLGFWRCGLCASPSSCSGQVGRDSYSYRKPNDFNRKDLFVQHVKRMHPLQISQNAYDYDHQHPTAARKSNGNAKKSPESEAEKTYICNLAKDCWRDLHPPPRSSACLFCDMTFNGDGSWGERLEHIARHMEGAKPPGRKIGGARGGDDAMTEPALWRRDERVEEWLLREKIVEVAPGTGGALRLVDIRT